MSTRRLFLGSFAALSALAGAPRAHADAASTAADFINTLLRDLVRIVNSDQPHDQKQAALQKIVESNVDITEVARFCLGRYWRVATPAQQNEYMDLFHRALVNSVTNKVGDYRGVTYAMGRPAPRDDNVDVPTTLTRPNNAPSKVEWIVSMASGAPKIIDLIAEGVSLRLTQRSDYASYLERNSNNVQALIDALRRQANNPQG